MSEIEERVAKAIRQVAAEIDVESNGEVDCDPMVFSHRFARAAIAAMPGEPGLQFNEMLLNDCKRMRSAGLKLSEAAMYVIRECDGLHRLSLAVAEWTTAVANEGGRGERYTSPSLPSSEPGGWQEIETAPEDGRKVWIYGGRSIAPCETEADGEWWRRMAAEGNTAVPTHWMDYKIPDPPSKSAPVFKASQNTAESDPVVTPGCAGADNRLPPSPAPSQENDRG